MLGREGCLMIDGSHSFYALCNLLLEDGVGAVGIGANGIGRHGEKLVRYNLAFSSGVVQSCFYVVDLAFRYAECIDSVSSDVKERLLLANEIAAAWHSMEEGNGAYLHASVFIDDFLLLCVHLVENNLEWRVFAEVVYLRLENANEVFWTIDVEVGGASEQSKCRDQSDESEAMITMQMSEEDGVEMRELES